MPVFGIFLDLKKFSAQLDLLNKAPPKVSVAACCRNFLLDFMVAYLNLKSNHCVDMTQYKIFRVVKQIFISLN
jgi:hypothetical protein